MQAKNLNQLKIVLEIQGQPRPQSYAEDNKFHQDRLLRITIRKATQRHAVFGSGSTTRLLSKSASLRAATRAQGDDE